jgi:hypothetical protein
VSATARELAVQSICKTDSTKGSIMGRLLKSCLLSSHHALR